MDNLEKLDLIRERLNVSYAEANKALEEANGDVVKALVKLENENQSSKKDADEKTTKENINVKGQELLDKIKQIIKEGNVNKISVKDKNDKTLVEIPVTAGIISLVLFPYLGILAGMAAMYRDYTLEIEKKQDKKGNKYQEEDSDSTDFSFKY